MRRIKTWPCDAEDCVQRVIVTQRDFRLMRAVVRAAEELLDPDSRGDDIALDRAIHAFNAPEKRK